jgi:hypothetical protein
MEQSKTKFTPELHMASNCPFSCLSLPRAGIIGVYHHTWLPSIATSQEKTSQAECFVFQNILMTSCDTMRAVK